MGNVITAAQLQKKLEVGVKVKSLEAMNEVKMKSAADRLFTDQNTTLEKIDVSLTNTIPEYEKFTGQVPYADVQDGHNGLFYNHEYVNGFQIQQRFIRTNQYPRIWPRASYELGLSQARTQENLSMSVFRNANNTTVLTLPDGQAMASTAHPSSMDASFTQSNLTTTGLSKTQLESITQTLGSRWKTPREEPMMINFDTLVIPPELLPTAQRLNETLLGGASGGANFDVNVQYQKWNIIVSPYLTDSNNYFVIDSARMKMNLYRNWVARNEIGAAEDFDSFAAKWRGYFFMGLEVDDWTWIYCGIVA